MIGLILIGVILFIIVVILGTAFWRAGNSDPYTYRRENASIAIWIVGVILSLAIISTGIVLNEQAQAEYAKYDAVEWYGVSYKETCNRISGNHGNCTVEDLGNV